MKSIMIKLEPSLYLSVAIHHPLMYLILALLPLESLRGFVVVLAASHACSTYGSAAFAITIDLNFYAIPNAARYCVLEGTAHPKKVLT
jgi:hypothetical protein